MPAAVAPSTNNAPQSPACASVAETLERAAEKLEGCVQRLSARPGFEDDARNLKNCLQRLRARAVALKPSPPPPTSKETAAVPPVVAETAEEVEKMPLPKALAEALGDTLKTVTCVGVEDMLTILGPGSFAFCKDPKPEKMPSSFVKTTNGFVPAFLVRCAPVKAYEMKHAKIVIICRRFLDVQSCWTAGAILKTQHLYRCSYQDRDAKCDLLHRHFGYPDLNDADFQAFAGLAAGKDVTDSWGTVWRKI